MGLSNPSVEYMVRIIEVLSRNNEISLTNLAMMSRINYQRCRDVVAFFESSRYVSTRSEGKRRYVALTVIGRDFGRRLMEVTNHRSLSPDDVAV